LVVSKIMGKINQIEKRFRSEWTLLERKGKKIFIEKRKVKTFLRLGSHRRRGVGAMNNNRYNKKKGGTEGFFFVGGRHHEETHGGKAARQHGKKSCK